MLPPLMDRVPPILVVTVVASTALVKVVAPVLLMVTAPSLPASPTVSENITAPEPVFTCRDCGVSARKLFTLPLKLTLLLVVIKDVVCNTLAKLPKVRSLP